MYVFFFFKQKTAYEMRISDWSSDVCSSDLYFAGFVMLADNAETYWPMIDAALDEAAARGVTQRFVWALPQVTRDGYTRLAPTEGDDMQAFDDEIGRASWRERVCRYV